MVRTRGTFRAVAIAGALLLLVGIAPAANAAARAVSTTPDVRAAAVRAALGTVGSPYHRGAAGPGRFDCSGLVTFAYTTAGHPLTGRSSYDLFLVGAPVKRPALRPGDLVWTWDRALGHVGVYVGGGRYAHAPGAGRRVELARLPSGAAYLGAVRP